MKGLYQVTAQKGKRILSSEVYGDSDDEDSLFSRLMNRHKIIHSQRPLFKLMDIKLNKDMTKSSFKFRDYQRTIISQGVGVLKSKRFLYLAMEVRTGKTLTSLGIADEIGAGNVLFLTKKKAISTIESDYAMLNPKYNLVVMNYESIHKLPQDMWDLIVCDESHSMGAFPKPSKRAKQVRELIAKNNPYVILMSGTPTPESFSQMYHQVYGIPSNPFNQYKNFYRFCDDYVTVTEKKINGLRIRDYSNGKQSIIDIMKAYTISYSQKEAGFKVDTREHKLYVKMDDITYNVAKKLKKDLVVEGKDEVILGDTSVKLMTKLHQIYSGTIKFESGNSKILDLSKARFIHDNFGDSKVGIFYKFKEEYNALKEVYGDNLCTELDEFNTTDKTIALQIQSGREGISLRKAEALVYYNIDFSATSYWQSRDRMTTKDRLESDVYWIFAEKGIENKIYKAVSDKKDYTTKHFKKDLLNL
ncbi:SNF2-related protein [Verrucomicrobiales bacterium]|nr:SNF2-related protein [Verrucomicrobiales bacterium]